MALRLDSWPDGLSGLYSLLSWLESYASIPDSQSSRPHVQIEKQTQMHCNLLYQVRITRGKLASGSPIPRPALLAKSSRTRSYVGRCPS